MGAVPLGFKNKTGALSKVFEEWASLVSSCPMRPRELAARSNAWFGRSGPREDRFRNAFGLSASSLASEGDNAFLAAEARKGQQKSCFLCRAPANQSSELRVDSDPAPARQGCDKLFDRISSKNALPQFQVFFCCRAKTHPRFLGGSMLFCPAIKSDPTGQISPKSAAPVHALESLRTSVRFGSARRVAVPGTGLDRERHCANWAEGCGSRAFGRHFGLSDVTDWSDHWIGAFFPLNHSWPQMFERIRRRMPFLGAETALACVLGRRVGHFPRPWPQRPKQAGFLWKRFRATFWGFYRPVSGRLEDSRRREPARRRTHDYGRFFVETVPKGYMFGTRTARKRLDLK